MIGSQSQSVIEDVLHAIALFNLPRFYDGDDTCTINIERAEYDAIVSGAQDLDHEKQRLSPTYLIRQWPPFEEGLQVGQQLFGYPIALVN